MTSTERWGSHGFIMDAVWMPGESVQSWDGSQVGTRD